MLDTLITFLGPQIRKLIYGACMSWITVIVEWASLHNIPITQAVIDSWISILIALLGMAVTALWTWGYNKFTSQVRITVPTVVVPEVAATVAAAK
ncbi:MAG: hypothetical protein WC455_25090 [Dehalococcoidia bacterium]|jgi:uncharacterized membrane protein